MTRFSVPSKGPDKGPRGPAFFRQKLFTCHLTSTNVSSCMSHGIMAAALRAMVGGDATQLIMLR